MKSFENAIALVVKTNNLPCLLRCMDAAAIAGGLTEKEDTITAAYLCAAFEKGLISSQDVSDTIVPACAQPAVTEQSAEVWHVERQKVLDFVAAAGEDEKIVVLANRLADLRVLYRDFLLNGDAIWGNFIQKDKFMHAWYYRELANLFSSFEPSAAYKEFVELVDYIFESQFDL